MYCTVPHWCCVCVCVCVVVTRVYFACLEMWTSTMRVTIGGVNYIGTLAIGLAGNEIRERDDLSISMIICVLDAQRDFYPDPPTTAQVHA